MRSYTAKDERERAPTEIGRRRGRRAHGSRRRAKRVARQRVRADPGPLLGIGEERVREDEELLARRARGDRVGPASLGDFRAQPSIVVIQSAELAEPRDDAVAAVRRAHEIQPVATRTLRGRVRDARRETNEETKRRGEDTGEGGESGGGVASSSVVGDAGFHVRAVPRRARLFRRFPRRAPRTLPGTFVVPVSVRLALVVVPVSCSAVKCTFVVRPCHLFGEAHVSERRAVAPRGEDGDGTHGESQKRAPRRLDGGIADARREVRPRGRRVRRGEKRKRLRVVPVQFRRAARRADPRRRRERRARH